MTLSVPRDRAGTFDPKLIAKYQRRFPDFDDKIISMYARGMTVREIRGHLEELYGIEVSGSWPPSRTQAGHPVRYATGRTEDPSESTGYFADHHERLIVTANGSAGVTE